jgi:aldose 1-epimerase
MPEIVLSSADLIVVIEPTRGGRIEGLRFQDVELLVQEQEGTQHDPVFAGSYVMAPFAGRIRDGEFVFDDRDYSIALCPGHEHAMHGFALDRPWDVVEQSATKCVLQIQLDERWPFGGKVEQTIELMNNNLHQEICFTATSRTPVWLGWHPWWRRNLLGGSSAELRFVAKAMLEREGALPTGQVVNPKAQPWDDAFTDVVGNPQIVWPEVVQLEMTSNHNWWVVYNEREDAICIEPQSGPPNAIELGQAVVLEADETHSISSDWIFSAL